LSGAPQVLVSVTTATAPSITTPAFNVGMIAGYHTHYADRQRSYASASAMVADGFLTTEPLYRMAEVYFGQNPAPNQLVVGRRANPYTQTLDLVLTDLTSGNVYSFSVIGSDDVVHPILFTSTGVPATDATSIAALFNATRVVPGAANSGTLALTVASGTPTANGTLAITITTAGAAGTAVFSWTFGALGGTGVTTGASVPLSGTGLTLDFGAGTAVLGDTYAIYATINVGTVSHSSATLVFTQASGKLNDIVGWMDGPSPQNLQLTDVTADPGITADLAAIIAANSLAWYGFSLDSNSKAEILPSFLWAQGTGVGGIGKFGFFTNSDFADVNGAGFSSSDVFATAEADSYGKGGMGYSGQEVLAYSGVSLMSYCMGQTPGYYVTADKNFPGCLADSDASLTLAQALVLNTDQASQPGTGGKNGNYYCRENGQNVFWPGVTPAGTYIDYPIWLDFIVTAIQTSILAAKSGPPKVSYDANGLQVIYSAILAPLTQAATPDAFGNVAILQTSIVVTVPTLAEIAAASIANRDLPNASWSCTYVGGIQTVTAKGVVTL
jgi:hypothetical protein